MPATILWAAVAAWFLLVGVAVAELFRGWLRSRETIGPR